MKTSFPTTKKMFGHLAIIAFALISTNAFAQSSNDTDDENLLDSFINSKGYRNVISFDASNVKQFWIDKSVAGLDKNINILFEKNGKKPNESVPLKVQLANVNETQDCRIDVITNNPGIKLAIKDNKLKDISTTLDTDNFLQYHIISSLFHLEDTPDFSFILQFSSDTETSVSIKKIVFSFSENKDPSFLFSPGTLILDESNMSFSGKKETDNGKTVFRGKRTQLLSKKYIHVSDNTLSAAVTLKNVGDLPTTIYLGYRVFTEKKEEITKRSFPYKKQETILTVVSANANSDKIIVDKYAEWAKNCYLALNPKEDLSDLPNMDFVEGRIVEVKQLDNGQAEITIEKPLSQALEEGTKIRINGATGGFIYTKTQTLQPGEEATLSSSIKKDDSVLQYLDRVFPKGTFYAKPLLMSYSTDLQKENAIVISDFSVSF